MSRIGRKPIALPAGVQVEIEDSQVLVRGPKGELCLPLHKNVKVSLTDNQVIVLPLSDDSSLQGLTRSLIANAVLGVTQGFEKRLHIIGIGYRADVEGRLLKLSLGFSHPISFPAPDGIEFSVSTATLIQLNLPLDESSVGSTVAVVTVRGVDKQKVGQVAAEIRSLRPPEAYKGKGIRYEGEVVHIKPGKQAI